MVNKNTMLNLVIFLLLTSIVILLSLVIYIKLNSAKQKLQQPVVFQQKNIESGFSTDPAFQDQILSGYIHSVHLGDDHQPYITVNSDPTDFLSPFSRKKVKFNFLGNESVTMFLNATSKNMEVENWTATTRDEISSLGLKQGLFVTITFSRINNNCASLKDDCQASNITLHQYVQ